MTDNAYSCRKYYAAHREQEMERKKKYYEEHAEERREYQRRYRKENKPWQHSTKQS